MKNYKEKKLYILHDVFLLLTVAVFLFLCLFFFSTKSLFHRKHIIRYQKSVFV